jgi:phosphoribosylaminoimidazolecarboxamide formyltransferase/IMP cyclohydrolase
MGQVNRVDAVQQSIDRWKKHHPDQKSVVLASDAFFPFADSVRAAAKEGIQWIIQPGGSIKDDEVIKAAKDCGINMIFTHKRHFKH